MATNKAKRKSPRVESQKYLTKATLSHFRVSPRKARMVLDLIKGKQVEPAVQILRYATQKTAEPLLKLLNSAIANAKEHHQADVDRLWVVGG